MSPSYGEVPYKGLVNEHGCICQAHRQHRLFRFTWANPSASQKEIARELKMSVANVKQGLWALRQRRLDRLCPECFEEDLINGICRRCGFEPLAPSLPVEILKDSQSPTNSIHPGNFLGSETDYQKVAKKLHFVNHGEILKRRVERGIEDPLVKAVKSDVENELKRSYPSEAITDEAGKLCKKEVLELSARYPSLVSSKNARKQCSENVLRRLEILHPQLRNSCDGNRQGLAS